MLVEIQLDDPQGNRPNVTPEEEEEEEGFHHRVQVGRNGLSVQKDEGQGVRKE